MDSLERVEFVMELEREFGLDLGDRDVEALGSAPMLADVWRTLRRLQGAPVGEDDMPLAADPTWRRLARVVARCMAMPLDDVRWTDRPFGDRPQGGAGTA
ncbi:hypothetical protein J421_5385 (plasmid) [Gemmatirosa kalamazoonensis]|uniref:Carrier domain-containing protein n=1 Tax=Gemmatirosa kalamazoonensis TaxID=861299 RepID=W0RRH3_9BACT|nr:phosphopantetheine-binding protein [Gemmatirosa kalamazoonensis]AHG92920.1 hypothetical protein J421_5385 [Gemmatirosa kalamazoonensis]